MLLHAAVRSINGININPLLIPKVKIHLGALWLRIRARSISGCLFLQKGLALQPTLQLALSSEAVHHLPALPHSTQQMYGAFNTKHLVLKSSLYSTNLQQNYLYVFSRLV